MKAIKATALLSFAILASIQIYLVATFSGVFRGLHPFIWLFIAWLVVMGLHRLIGGSRTIPHSLTISIYICVACLIVVLQVQHELLYRLLGLCPPLLILAQCVAGLIDFAPRKVVR